MTIVTGEFYRNSTIQASFFCNLKGNDDQSKTLQVVMKMSNIAKKVGTPPPSKFPSILEEKLQNSVRALCHYYKLYLKEI